MSHTIMTELLKGTCEFKVIQDVGKESGKEYKAIRLKINDYEISRPLFVNEEILYCIKKAMEE